MITCALCGCSVPDVNTAVELGWAPSFYRPGDEWETNEPICCECAEEMCEVDETGELVFVID